MAKRAKKQPKIEPKWRTVEKVAAMVERVLDPSATVEHDVRLPDLLTPEAQPRQCDIVVTTGPDHRRTRTIVEVQRRNKKVEPAHLAGWLDKMRAVGAQHLVCVSAAGFSETVIVKAAQHGPTVRLATLKEVAQNSPLLQGLFGALVSRQSKTTAFRDVEIIARQPAEGWPVQGELDLEHAVFRFQRETLTLPEIAQRTVGQCLGELGRGQHDVAVEPQEELTFLGYEHVGPVRVRFIACVEVAVSNIACEVLEYRHIEDESGLTWVMLGTIPRSDGGEYRIRIPFRTAVDGRLWPQSFTIEGARPGEMIQATMGPLKAGPVLVPR